MINKKIKASSISTESCSKVQEKIQTNPNIKTSEDIEFDPKKDAELLSLGTRPEGGPQAASPKVKNRWKYNELDLGKYMSSGYSVSTTGSNMNKKVK